MFSSECPLWHVSRACHPLYLFPRLPPVEAFPRWKCVTCFPAISTRYMFSRACHPLPVCPRLPPVACAVTKASYINFQLAYCTIRCCSDLRRENFDLLLQEFFNCPASRKLYQSYLEQFNPVRRQFDKNKTAVRQEHFFDILWNLSNKFNRSNLSWHGLVNSD